MRLTKLICLLLVALFGLSTTVYAAPSGTYRISDQVANADEVDALAEELEEKYGITILYPTVTGEDGRQLATIHPQMLKTLDEALETVTPRFVRHVSAYYYEKNQRRLTYEYVYADLRGPYGLGQKPEVQVGGFNRRSSRIVLYIPQDEGQAIATGDNPLTIVHEFSHAVHFMICDQYGHARMEREWLALMDGWTYSPAEPDSTVFVTGYAATEFDEDFAEVFAHAFVCNRPGLGLSNRLGTPESPTPLGKKVAYLEQLLTRYMGDYTQMLENYRKVRETPPAISEAGLRLSGSHLLFINMEEPRTVPLMLLNNLYVYEKNTIWLSTIGGWYTKDLFGNNLVLFPEGTYGHCGRDLTEYKAELDAKAAEEEKARQEAEAQPPYVELPGRQTA